MTTLPSPVFATPDPTTAETLLTKYFEDLAGKAIYPAQPEALLLNWMAYLKALVDASIQYTGEQNLVTLATGTNLDQIGALWNLSRLTPTPALTTLRFTLVAAEGSDRLIPAGTRAITSDSKHLFATIAAATIPAGDTTIDVEAQATVAGDAANNYPVGQINKPFDILSNLNTVENITVTNSGSDTEKDNDYRERLKLAPNALTTSGTRDNIKLRVLSADPTITSVTVIGRTGAEKVADRDQAAENFAQTILDYVVAEGGTLGTATAAGGGPLVVNAVSLAFGRVEVYPLTKTGLPSNEILTKVRNVLNNNSTRTLNDEYLVASPNNVSYAISATITIYASADATQLQSDLEDTAQALADDVAASMGRNVVPAQFVDALRLEGVYNVVLSSPAALTEIAYNQRAVASSITITIGGTVDDAN